MPGVRELLMEVISPPRIQGTTDIECRGCRAVVRCRASELRFESDPRDGNAYVMICPLCKHETWIAASLVNK